MKSFMAFVFGVSIGVVIPIISPYTLLTWQFWAAWAPIAITGFIYASIK